MRQLLQNDVLQDVTASAGKARMVLYNNSTQGDKMKRPTTAPTMSPRMIVATAVIAVLGAVGGIVTTPKIAVADEGGGPWKCAGMYFCGAGEQPCCYAGNGGSEICTTMCEIIIH